MASPEGPKSRLNELPPQWVEELQLGPQNNGESLQHIDPQARGEIGLTGIVRLDELGLPGGQIHFGEASVQEANGTHRDLNEDEQTHLLRELNQRYAQDGLEIRLKEGVFYVAHTGELEIEEPDSAPEELREETKKAVQDVADQGYVTSVVPLSELEEEDEVTEEMDPDAPRRHFEPIEPGGVNVVEKDKETVLVAEGDPDEEDEVGGELSDGRTFEVNEGGAFVTDKLGITRHADSEDRREIRSIIAQQETDGKRREGALEQINESARREKRMRRQEIALQLDVPELIETRRREGVNETRIKSEAMNTIRKAHRLSKEEAEYIFEEALKLQHNREQQRRADQQRQREEAAQTERRKQHEATQAEAQRQQQKREQEVFRRGRRQLVVRQRDLDDEFLKIQDKGGTPEEAKHALRNQLWEVPDVFRSMFSQELEGGRTSLEDLVKELIDEAEQMSRFYRSTDYRRERIVDKYELPQLITDLRWEGENDAQIAIILTAQLEQLPELHQMLPGESRGQEIGRIIALANAKLNTSQLEQVDKTRSRTLKFLERSNIIRGILGGKTKLEHTQARGGLGYKAPVKTWRETAVDLVPKVVEGALIDAPVKTYKALKWMRGQRGSTRRAASNALVGYLAYRAAARAFHLGRSYVGLYLSAAKWGFKTMSRTAGHGVASWGVLKRAVGEANEAVGQRKSRLGKLFMGMALYPTALVGGTLGGALRWVGGGVKEVASKDSLDDVVEGATTAWNRATTGGFLGLGAVKREIFKDGVKVLDIFNVLFGLQASGAFEQFIKLSVKGNMPAIEATKKIWKEMSGLNKAYLFSALGDFANLDQIGGVGPDGKSKTSLPPILPLLSAIFTASANNGQMMKQIAEAFGKNSKQAKFIKMMQENMKTEGEEQTTENEDAANANPQQQAA